MAMETTFTLERETKNAVRYKEDGEDFLHKVGTLYVKKAQLNAEYDSFPDKIKVFISDISDRLRDEPDFVDLDRVDQEQKEYNDAQHDKRFSQKSEYEKLNDFINESVKDELETLAK